MKIFNVPNYQNDDLLDLFLRILSKHSKHFGLLKLIIMQNTLTLYYYNRIPLFYNRSVITLSQIYTKHSSTCKTFFFIILTS